MLPLWPGEVRRKREDDFGRMGPALFAGTNISDQSIRDFFNLLLRTHFMDGLSKKTYMIIMIAETYFEVYIESWKYIFGIVVHEQSMS